MKATQFNKLGDHAAVLPYPIKDRIYDGILPTDGRPNVGHAVKFGDWIIEEDREVQNDDPKQPSTKQTVLSVLTPAQYAKLTAPKE